MPVLIPLSSAFRKYVGWVFETGCLALYEKKIKGINKRRKTYTDCNNSDNSDDGDEGINK